ncbi:MAG: hypothetical protein M1819_006972 [Sarea resinae]|nr:MAG: hypothetical protein M1819_006972 [Sarea resinae]
MKWSPSLIKQKHWDCPEAIELNNWTHTMKSHHQKLPPNAFRDNSPSAVPAALVSVNALRHSAVHRLHTSAKGISEMVHSAAAFADLLGDTSRQLQLEELHRELESKLRAQELHKNYLETRINQEFDEIGALREALDKREKEAVATFLKEDRENQFIIGSLLEDSVRETLPKEKGLEIGVDPVRQGVDPEDEAGVIELEKDYPSDMGDVPEGLPLGKAEEYDSSPSKELLLGALSAEELSDKERPVEDQPAEEPSAGEPEPDVQQWELPELRESSPEKIEKGFSDMELPAHTTEESLHEAPENEWINRPASGIQLAESIPLEEEPADEPQATKMYDVVDDSVQAEQESPLETEVLQEIVGTDDPHVRTDLGCSIVHMLDENDQIVRDEIRSLFLD